MKIAKTNALYKTGSKTDVSNYLPISLLSTISKSFEKLIHKRMSCFPFKHKIVSKSQCEFQPNKLCKSKHARTEFVDFMRTTMDSKLPGSALFVDLKKASDTISHKKLFYKHECYGF